MQHINTIIFLGNLAAERPYEDFYGYTFPPLVKLSIGEGIKPFKRILEGREGMQG